VNCLRRTLWRAGQRGADTNLSATNVTMNWDKTVTANFNRVASTLTMAISGARYDLQVLLYLYPTPVFLRLYLTSNSIGGIITEGRLKYVPKTVQEMVRGLKDYVGMLKKIRAGNQGSASSPWGYVCQRKFRSHESV